MKPKPNVDSLFCSVIEIEPPESRQSFLDQACGEDIELRRQVERLVDAHFRGGSIVDSPNHEFAPTVLPESHAKPGCRIGPYKLLQQIGEGGMGVVYMAEQEVPVRRRVAVKIIRPGMDSRQVIARFEAERQALAMMDHQNIARVLDAGTTESGRPYFVMELVHGVPMTKYCDDNRLTLQQRLELFIPVCQAIQHAHHKGVIHRDIKPGNILVTMYDDKPVPKVIDFGVAKAVEQRLTEKTLFTQFGTLVGTFEYMSPEQAEMNALGVDTRSDVYSLGVLLYELLTGTTPLERQRLRDTALQELIRIIREEEPQRPSLRLSTSSTLPKVAAACRVDPAQLPQLVRGELDWIVMKCLEKDRTRRYETANGLARDVQRYLANESVEACPPSVGYRFRKFASKHRRLLAMTSSLAALLLIGIVVSSSMAAWALREKNLAQTARAEALTALNREQVAREDAESAKRRAESFSQRLRTAMQCTSDGIDAYHRENWAEAYDQFNQAQDLEAELWTTFANRANLFTTLGLWDLAAEDYEQRFKFASKSDASTYAELAILRLYVGDEPGYRRACKEQFTQHGGAKNARQQILQACTLSPASGVDAAELARRGENLLAVNYVPLNLAIAGMAHLRARDYQKAVDRLSVAIKLGNRSPGGIHQFSYAPLALAYHSLGKTTEAGEALTHAQQAIDGWTKEMTNSSVGKMPIHWSDWLMALILYREARTAIRGIPPAEDPRLAILYGRATATISQGDSSRFMLAVRNHVSRGEWDQAANAYEKVLGQLASASRSGESLEMGLCVEIAQTPEVFKRLITLRPKDNRLWFARGRTLANAGKWKEAIADYEQALKTLTSDAPPLTHVFISFELAALLLLDQQTDRYHEVAASISRQQFPIDDDTIHQTVANQVAARLCSLLPNAVDRPEKVTQFAQTAVAFNPDFAWHQFALGLAEFRAGQNEAAVKSLTASLELNPEWIGRGQNYIVLAMTCQRLGQVDLAKDWLQQSRTWMAEIEERRKGNKYGFATSDYLADWLSGKVLLAEAERLIVEGNPE